MSKFKPILKILLKAWMKFVFLWNKTVIFTFILIIWFFILTPTAFVRRLFRRIKSLWNNKKDSFLKKSQSLSVENFTRPF